MSETEASNGQGTPVFGQLGILFVHGIGMQKRGETLSAFGVPLIKWLQRWGEKAGKRFEVEVEGSLLVEDPEDPEAPAHTCVNVIEDRTTGTGSKFLMAECCWAESFPVPSFSSVAHWAIRVLPWTTATQLAVKWKSLLVRHAGRISAYPYICFEGLTYLALFFLSALLQLAVFVLLIFSVVPIKAVREFILSIQLKIAAIAGDSYVLLENPIKSDAIVERVIRDIRWLVDTQNCDRIAIVAHSQGGAVAHRVLETATAHEPGLEKVELFFSFGSGLGKLHDIEGRVSGGSSRLWVAFIGVVGLIITSFMLPPLVRDLFTDPNYFQTSNVFHIIIVYIAFCATAIALGVIAVLSSESRSDLVPPPFGAYWVDRYSSRDPVPAGPLIPDTAVPNSAVVSNRHSILSDHTSYLDNCEEFVSSMAMELAPYVPLDLTDSYDDGLALTDAPRHRRWRVRWLAFFRFVMLASSLFGVWALDRLGLLGSFSTVLTESIREDWPGFAVSLSEDTFASFEVLGPQLSSALVIILLHVAWYFLVICYAWRAWDARETRRFFDRKPVDLGGFYLPFMMLLVLLPVAVIALLLWTGGPVPIVAFISSLPEIPRSTLMAIFIAIVITLSLTATCYFFVVLFVEGEREKWQSEHRVAGVLMCAATTFIFSVAIMLVFLEYFPQFFTGNPGALSWKEQLASGAVGLFGGVALVVGVGYLIARFGPTGRPYPRLARLHESITDWLLDHAWSASWETDPDSAHSRTAAATIAFVCGAAAVIIAFFIYHGWQTHIAALSMIVTLFIATMMGFNTRMRSRDAGDILAYWISRISLYLAFGAFMMPGIIANFWPAR